MKKQFKLNTKLLIQSLSLQSISKEDDEARSFIYDKLGKIKDVTVSEDDYGNITAVKGITDLYPSVCCHYDTVHKTIIDKKVKQEKDLLYAFSHSLKRQVGIGGDDLVGIALCLQLLEELPTLKAVFYRDEEVGLIGAKAFNLSFFDDCAYVIEIDRRDNDDFSISMGGVDVNSKEFVTACTPFLKKYKYKESYTSITDVYNLKLRGLNISVTNVSCGYYNPHSSNETVSITDVNNCYCMVFDIICNITNKKYVHNYKPPVYNNPHAYGYNNNQGVIIRYHDMYLDIHNYDKDGYYLYNGLAKTITITESYSYLIDIKAIFNKKTLQYFFLDKWFKGEYDEIQERRINYLLKKVKIQDGGQTFVYNYLYDNWLLEKHAVLYECGENASTYITKATYEEWANYKK